MLKCLKWMNEDDADLGSGSGFLSQYNDKQQGVKNPICNDGCSQPILVGYKSLNI